jgi:uncharacterized protein
MKCPTCPDATLVMTERSGVEIDYCPTCRGVWLDRGELDKIIERVAVASPAPAPAAPMPSAPMQSAPAPGYDPGYREPYRNSKYHSKYHTPYGKKRKGLLGEIFDF